uniref:Uncharacterized protein n=1 Tax=Rhizophagus irregularis (strain DAOM 181602 / DAOM 197198 / MUCL 43194) TaxID=747089 RepID=U9UM64_RHIID
MPRSSKTTILECYKHWVNTDDNKHFTKVFLSSRCNKLSSIFSWYPSSSEELNLEKINKESCEVRQKSTDFNLLSMKSVGLPTLRLFGDKLKIAKMLKVLGESIASRAGNFEYDVDDLLLVRFPNICLSSSAPLGTAEEGHGP